MFEKRFIFLFYEMVDILCLPYFVGDFVIGILGSDRGANIKYSDVIIIFVR